MKVTSRPPVSVPNARRRPIFAKVTSQLTPAPPAFKPLTLPPLISAAVTFSRPQRFARSHFRERKFPTAPPAPLPCRPHSLRFPRKSLVGHPSAFQAHRNFPVGGGVATYRSNFLRPSFSAPPASPPPPRFSRMVCCRDSAPCGYVALHFKPWWRLAFSLHAPTSPPTFPPPQFLLDSSVADHCPASPPALSSRDSRRSNFPATLRRVPPCAVFAQITFRPKPPAFIFAEAQRIPRKTGRGNFSRK